jgi:HAD superfamily hydrolase (TIGR01509 family)
MPAVAAVLFDWDGTLADSFATTRHASLSVFRHFGIPMNEARYQATYRPDWHETYRQLGIPEDRWDEAGVIWRERYLERSHAVTLFPDARDTLDALSDRGLRLGVVTSADRQRFLEDLDRLGLLDRFDALVAFEDARKKKPHPEGLSLALSRLGVAPRDALYVGDRPEDVAMGKRAGTRTAALVSRFSGEAMLRSAAPDILLAAIGDLPGVLPGSPAAI